jgi:hypothetical protein
VAACKSTPGGSFAKAVPIGQERNLGGYCYLHEDCSSPGPTLVCVISQPAHGTVIIRQGRDYPTYAQSNPRSLCNTHPVPMTSVYYRSSPDYAGPDAFTMDVIFPNGGTRQDRLDITVK